MKSCKLVTFGYHNDSRNVAQVDGIFQLSAIVVKLMVVVLEFLDLRQWKSYSTLVILHQCRS